ncbi:DNA repair protein RecO [Haloferula sp. A504]|uniref:DNA repair protein RecO n=1 Tax=Haloferula sp. A504 TaxID=3373601 RepID=UPI0031C6DA64|nr:DNA repair protein RecO [Verrucomicrobiaceae bacterium E54]
MERSDGILVRLTKLTDTSFIVHWFTEDAGLIKTVAKGARRPKSPFAGKLDLFFSSEVHWTRARRGELHTLREAEPRHLREGIRRDYKSALLAGYFCRLLETAVEREHPEPALHDLLRRGLDHVDTSGASAKALRHFESELARLLGLGREKRQAAPALREALGGLPGLRDQALEALADSSKKPFADRPDKS